MSCMASQLPILELRPVLSFETATENFPIERTNNTLPDSQVYLLTQLANKVNYTQTLPQAFQTSHRVV